VRARGDGVLLETRGVRQVETLLEQLARVLEFLRLERRDGVLVHLGDLGDRVIGRVGFGSARERENEQERDQAAQRGGRGRPMGHERLASGGKKGTPKLSYLCNTISRNASSGPGARQAGSPPRPWGAEPPGGRQNPR